MESGWERVGLIMCTLEYEYYVCICILTYALCIYMYVFCFVRTHTHTWSTCIHHTCIHTHIQVKYIILTENMKWHPKFTVGEGHTLSHEHTYTQNIHAYIHTYIHTYMYSHMQVKYFILTENMKWHPKFTSGEGHTISYKYKYTQNMHAYIHTYIHTCTHTCR